MGEESFTENRRSGKISLYDKRVLMLSDDAFSALDNQESVVLDCLF